MHLVTVGQERTYTIPRHRQQDVPCNLAARKHREVRRQRAIMAPSSSQAPQPQTPSHAKTRMPKMAANGCMVKHAQATQFPYPSEEPKWRARWCAADAPTPSASPNGARGEPRHNRRLHTQTRTSQTRVWAPYCDEQALPLRRAAFGEQSSKLAAARTTPDDRSLHFTAATCVRARKQKRQY